MEDADLACCDGGRERWREEVSVLMGPGCRSVIAHTIRPPGRSMSGQPDKRMSAVEHVMYWEIGDSLGRGGHRLTDAPERGLESSPCWLDEEPYYGD